MKSTLRQRSSSARYVTTTIDEIGAVVARSANPRLPHLRRRHAEKLLRESRVVAPERARARETRCDAALIELGDVQHLSPQAAMGDILTKMADMFNGEEASYCIVGCGLPGRGMGWFHGLQLVNGDIGAARGARVSAPRGANRDAP